MAEWIGLGFIVVVIAALAWWNGWASVKHPTFEDEQARKYRKRGPTL
ncbi:MAG: hypothetical protein LCI03_14940 [Actinobacteria bacterium]|nr:hypothetical protein [Actinomycetota bacterium]